MSIVTVADFDDFFPSLKDNSEWGDTIIQTNLDKSIADWTAFMVQFGGFSVTDTDFQLIKEGILYLTLYYCRSKKQDWDRVIYYQEQVEQKRNGSTLGAVYSDDNNYTVVNPVNGEFGDNCILWG